MAMLRNAGTAYKIAKKVLGKENVKVPNPKENQPVNLPIQYISH